jgi:hypothetical protein
MMPLLTSWRSILGRSALGMRYSRKQMIADTEVAIERFREDEPH